MKPYARYIKLTGGIADKKFVRVPAYMSEYRVPVPVNNFSLAENEIDYEPRFKVDVYGPMNAHYDDADTWEYMGRRDF